MAEPRRFQLHRDRDISGVSGTGVVAEGVVFSDGHAAVHWLGRWPTTTPHPSVESIKAVHGHKGATRLAWLDVPSSEDARGAVAIESRDDVQEAVNEGDTPEAAMAIGQVIGQNVRARRRARGLSQTSFAAIAGCTRSSVANLEIGRQNIGVALLARLARALDATPADLLAALDQTGDSDA